jgi:endo-1,4-beta-xylanase
MNKEIKSLAQVYGGLFPVGAAVNPDTIKIHGCLLQKHFNSITPENEMKFCVIHPREDVYQFNEADLLADFAQKNGMKLRGHSLVWHNQNPKWLFLDETQKTVSRDTLLKRMEEHIHTVVGRYRNQVYCWDVVNEAVEDKAEYFLRKTPWLEIIGPDYISKAFEFARQADPEALLFYNDYNETFPEKLDKIYGLVKELKEKGTPIDGIGLQGHWNIFKPSLGEIGQAIEKYASLGLKLQITELDVSMFLFEDQRTDLTAPTPEMLERQAEFLDGVFRICREYRDVIIGVTLWGVADDRTWLDDFPVRRKNWPLLFDTEHQPKKAFWEIVEF